MEKLKVILLAVTIVCGSAQTSARGSVISIRGWISDVRCGAKGASASHEECLRQCLHNGDRLTLVTDVDEKVLIVDGPEALKGHEAQHVAVYGIVNSAKGTVHVERVEMLAGN